MVSTITKDVTNAAAEIARGLLVEHYKDTVVFDPIVVIPKIDDYDKEYLHIYIVHDCDREMLDAEWDISLYRLIIPGLAQLGVQTTPNFSFIPRKDWDEENWDEFLREWHS